jgi:hypothetical protein
LHVSRNQVTRPDGTPMSPVQFEPLMGKDGDYRALKFHVVHFKDAVPAADLVLVPNDPHRKISLTSIGFVLSEGVLVFNSHQRDGKCCLRAIQLENKDVGRKKTLWRVPLAFNDGRCRCAAKRWRVKLYASGEKLAALYYPTSPSPDAYPMCAFFWIRTGAPCSEVFTLRGEDFTKEGASKCSLM